MWRVRLLRSDERTCQNLASATAPVPALLLGQFAVDRRYQKRGCAGSLLRFALKTAVRLLSAIWHFGVLNHPLDEGARDLYTRFCFETLPFRPGASMIVRIVDLDCSGASSRDPS